MELRQDPRLQRVLAVVDSIPEGRLATYGQVAREAGLPGRARWVGQVLSQLAGNSGIPWHRVVNASGGISPRPGPGPKRQRKLLEREGHCFSPGGRLALESRRWHPDT